MRIMFDHELREFSDPGFTSTMLQEPGPVHQSRPSTPVQAQYTSPGPSVQVHLSRSRSICPGPSVQVHLSRSGYIHPGPGTSIQVRVHPSRSRYRYTMARYRYTMARYRYTMASYMAPGPVTWLQAQLHGSRPSYMVPGPVTWSQASIEVGTQGGAMTGSTLGAWTGTWRCTNDYPLNQESETDYLGFGSSSCREV